MKMKAVKALPANAVTHYDHEAISRTLRADPGQWFKIVKGDGRTMHALAAKWRNARPKGFGAGDFDFRAVASEKRDGTAKLYGRYLDDAPSAD